MTEENKAFYEGLKETLNTLIKLEKEDLSDDYRKAFTEIVFFIDNSSEDITSRIPEAIKTYLRKNQDKDYKFNSESLEVFSETASNLISMIYIVYVLETEEEKEEMVDELRKK